MEKMNAGGVRRDDEGPIEISLSDGDDDERPKLQSDIGNDRSPCDTFTGSTSSSDIKCPDGGEQETTNSGAAAEGSSGDADGDDGGGNDATMEKNTEEDKPQKRAVRANMYAFITRDTIYHIEIKSSLGETYRNLPTKAEQREFMIKHGKAKPNNLSCRLRAVR